jgi:steroid delta-isomerase-like uncharacterized protein
VSTETNKAVVRAYVEAWNTRDLDRFDDLMSADAQLTVGTTTFGCGPEQTRATVGQWVDGFPDYRFELLDLIAEGDRVVARMPFSGTHEGPVLGLPPTGRTVRVDEIVIFRLVDGHIVEVWEVWDELAMRRQLAAR